jgi:ribosomal protein S24E
MSKTGIPRVRRKFDKSMNLKASNLELFQVKTNYGMERLKTKVKQLISDTNQFQ